MRHPTSNQLAAWYAEHYRAIVNYARRMAGEDQAEDIAQQTFLRAAQGNYTPTKPPRPLAWLYTIARHLVYDTARARARFPLRDADISEDRLIRDPQPSPHDQAASHETHGELDAAIGRLLPLQRDAIRAQLAGIRAAGTLRYRLAVKERRRRAIASLRRLLRPNPK